MYKVREIPLFDYWSHYLSDFLYYFIKTFSQPKFKLMQILYLISYPWFYFYVTLEVPQLSIILEIIVTEAAWYFATTEEGIITY